MSGLQDARQMLELAEQAAMKGDFSSANELLNDAARIQEAELGPLHPDLANTLNSLAIVAERTGRFGDAEACYRRSAAIASAALPADHPIVAESRKNLEDFCRERGVPILPAAVMTPSGRDSAVGLGSVTPEVAPVKSSPAPRTPPPTASQPASAPRRPSYRLAWIPIVAIGLGAVAMFVRQPSPLPSDSPPPMASPTAESAPPPPAVPAPSVTGPIEQVPPPDDTPGGADRAGTTNVVTETPPSSVPSPGAISLTTAQLCQTLSTSGGNWQCDPPGDPVAPGSIVLYTRVRSSRDAVVVHRWFRDDILRQTVTLAIRANVSEGYRTYSRQTVDGVGNWRVEVRSADDDLLHEQRFAVR